LQSGAVGDYIRNTKFTWKKKQNYLYFKRHACDCKDQTLEMKLKDFLKDSQDFQVSLIVNIFQKVNENIF